MKNVLILLSFSLVCFTGCQQECNHQEEVTCLESYDGEAKEFKLAMVQLKVAGGQLEANLNNAVAQIEKSAAAGAQIVLLPEETDLGWTHESALTKAYPIPEGKTFQRLATAAKSNDVYVIAGITEKGCDGTIYNAAVLIDRKGNLLLKHRKLNELDLGHHLYGQGDRLNVAKTEYGTIGMLICADGNTRGQVLLRSLCYMGADMILSPTSWAVPSDWDESKRYGDEWRAAYMPVAKDFKVWIAGASNTGPVTDGEWKGWNAIGNSIIIDHNGEEVATGPFGVDADSIVYVDVKPISRPVRGCDWNDYWDAQQDSLSVAQ